MLLGRQTWMFEQPPAIISTGIVGGPFEAQGNIADDFDLFFSDQWMEEKTFEQAHRHLIYEASKIATEKANLSFEDINVFLHGDLINQLTPTNFAASDFDIPFLGMFNACATSMEGLALSASILSQSNANYVLTGAASHHAAAERQFRYPTEYGSQKPETSQWTVTGSGIALLAKQGNGPKVTSATVGKVIDRDMTDPFNMGGAMAPAAFDTINTHLLERGVQADYYDFIITGDLGKIGRNLCYEMLLQQNHQMSENQLLDCGLIIYKPSQPVFSGGSGTACSSVVTYGHFIQQLNKKLCNKILVVATGALLSPLTVQQKETIPCIAHAVSIENND
ncbi:stage V sporulation protein AD [Gracilibacillus halophilus YIM-C55.5]|uniref:Stage V sporulation protein AD n=1 Tax=Gracilibacillus halophilus YIM-C55.5 TaxID=1308866 RepID=N4WA70_9BACI|nr:stage V sporulation protein AD [Gracilibacillus halophilus]ENH97193.1 stage V sporulation protein AD [Gracilibacillus halophilus YIM-C55.5]